MPMIRVSWWAGRTARDKAQVAQAITAAMVGVGIPAQATQVVFEDVPQADWFIGGVSATERQHAPIMRDESASDGAVGDGNAHDQRPPGA